MAEPLAAANGKSDLLLGLAITRHCDSIIYRTTYPELESLIERSEDIIGNLDNFNKAKNVWRNLPGDARISKRTLQFAAVNHEKDKTKFQGRPKDFIGLDEISNFTKTKFDFVTGWNRPSSRAPRNQRCRIVCTGNPPTSPEGRWVVEYWAPWLDSEHELYPYPPGQLIWFVSVDGKDIIVSKGDDKPPNYEHNGEILEPHSRTFIPASLSDNPDLNTPEYRATLQAMPEPLRSQMLFGDFNIAIKDDPWQVIPSQWVEDSFDRWKENKQGPKYQQTHMGVDVARGGEDSTILAVRRHNYIDKLVIFPGEQTPNGPKVAAQVLKHFKGGIVNIDASGVGGSPYDSLVGVIPIFAIGGGEASVVATRNNNLGFYNKRAEMIWKLRDMLDPELGFNLCLPPDNKLKAELCAITWEVKPPSRRQMGVKGLPGHLMLKGQIKVSEKEEMAKRLGRSPDRADAIIMSVLDTPVQSKSVGRSSAAW